MTAALPLLLPLGAARVGPLTMAGGCSSLHRRHIPSQDVLLRFLASYYRVNRHLVDYLLLPHLRHVSACWWADTAAALVPSWDIYQGRNSTLTKSRRLNLVTI